MTLAEDLIAINGLVPEERPRIVRLGNGPLEVEWTAPTEAEWLRRHAARLRIEAYALEGQADVLDAAQESAND